MNVLAGIRWYFGALAAAEATSVLLFGAIELHFQEDS